MTEHEEHRGIRGPMVLTQADLDEIKRVTSGCPHGMTAQDIFKLREFLNWWEQFKSTVGGYVIKGFIILLVAIGILVAWVLNAGNVKP